MQRKSIEIQPRYTAGEVFCGIGGLSRGFHSLGFEPKFANDVWPLALYNFLMNFDATYAATSGTHHGDILGLVGSVEDISISDILPKISSSSGEGSLKVGEIDVLLGGPPCQGFSLNSHVRSVQDPRNYLFRHYVRLLKGLSPKIFVLENVPGMLSLEGGHFFEEFLREVSLSTTVDCPGYEVRFKILNAAHYGVPQERFRVVVVGTRKDVADRAGVVSLPIPHHFSLAQAHFKGGRTHTFHYAIGRGKHPSTDQISHIGPQLEPFVTVIDAIGDLPKLTNGGGENVGRYGYNKDAPQLSKYQQNMRSDGELLANHWCRALYPPNTERIKHIPAGGDWRSIPRDLLPPGMQRALRKDHTKRYGRLSPTQLAGTLLTKPDPHWGTFIHYDLAQQRLISVREAARIQSFPDRHVFYGGQVDQYRLCGNAVPPLMAQAIAKQVKGVLDVYYGFDERKIFDKVVSARGPNT
ncbi:DNA cytosine methyltransferase [Beijerinckia indica]|uniref:DNA cytosine methyltransferase n=1 Tax=Beijerinckia indica TaxID=533 RepID=UPI001930DAB3|nr:DNA cytosine methyltransferase [Beijerinckia indica]